MLYLSIGTAATTKPEWYSSGAYREVLRFLPISRWGALMLLTGILFLAGVILHSAAALNMAFSLAFFIQMNFAWSIFYLTWNGAPGAFAGAIQWLTVGLISFWFLLIHPFYLAPEQGRDHEWN